MSAADKAWQEYAQATLLGWTAGENTRIRDGFVAGYRRALEDAADAYGEALYEFAMRGTRWDDWLRARAAVEDTDR